MSKNIKSASRFNLKLSYMAIGFICLASFVGGLSVYQIFQYDFKTLSGKHYKHSDLREHVVVVNYFAEWCAPCLREIPHLNEFYHQAPDKVKLFAISYDNLSELKLNEIKQKYKIEFPLISEIKSPFTFDKPQFLPATFIIRPSGEVAGQLLGEQTAQSLNEAISSL